MRLTVFGATGRTGRLVIEQALAAGDQVVAYARDSSKLELKHDDLTVVMGGLSDLNGIARAVSGADAVISVLGPRARSKGTPVAAGTENIIAAMKKHGVRRLVVTCTASAKDPNDRPEFKFRILIGIVKILIRPAYDDVVRTADTIRKSDLDWTIVRLSMLNNGPRSGNVKVGYMGSGEVGMRIARADIADFVLKEVREKKYLRQAPLISN